MRATLPRPQAHPGRRRCQWRVWVECMWPHCVLLGRRACACVHEPGQLTVRVQSAPGWMGCCHRAEEERPRQVLGGERRASWPRAVIGPVVVLRPVSQDSGVCGVGVLGRARAGLGQGWGRAGAGSAQGASSMWPGTVFGVRAEQGMLLGGPPTPNSLFPEGSTRGRSEGPSFRAPARGGCCNCGSVSLRPVWGSLLYHLPHRGLQNKSLGTQDVCLKVSDPYYSLENN